MHVAPDPTVGWQGYLYVEAHKESHVTDAIKGLRIIRVSKGARLVPLKEMVSAIYVNTQAKSQLGVPHRYHLGLCWSCLDGALCLQANCLDLRPGCAQTTQRMECMPNPCCSDCFNSRCHRTGYTMLC